MSLFWKKNTPIAIEPDEIKAIETIFRRLIYHYGIDYLHHRKTVDINKEYFPISYSAKKIDANAILQDVITLLNLKDKHIDIDSFEDNKSKVWSETNVLGSYRESSSELEWSKNGDVWHYHILIAKSYLNKSELLVSQIVFQCCRVKMIEDGLSIESLNNAYLYLHFSTIFFGFGIIACNTSYVDDYFPGGKYQVKSPVSPSKLGYAMALYSYLQKEPKPKWKKLLNSNCSFDFNASLDYLFSGNNSMFTDEYIDNMLKRKEVFSAASKAYHNKEYEKSINLISELIQKEPDSHVNYNQRGYYLLRIKRYDDAIKDLEESIKINPKYSYAYNNRGFAKLMKGELSQGLSDIITSIQYDSNNSYSYRNLGIYYTASGEYQLALENFLKAFSMNADIDLFYYFKGQLLLKMGKREEAVNAFKLSAEKGEPESTAKLLELW